MNKNQIGHAMPWKQFNATSNTMDKRNVLKNLKTNAQPKTNECNSHMNFKFDFFYLFQFIYLENNLL